MVGNGAADCEMEDVVGKIDGAKAMRWAQSGTTISPPYAPGIFCKSTHYVIRV